MVRIGSARIDERGKISGGKAGDQTGKELSTQEWYRHSKGWRVLRPKDIGKADRIAQAMERACANSKIGYDQNQRNTLYNLAVKVGFDPAKVSSACETDCSALVRVCCAYAGIKLADFNTQSEASRLLASGEFSEMTGAAYTDKSDLLRRGDVLVTRTKGHTAVVLTDGSKAEPAKPETPDESKEAETGGAGKLVVTGNTVRLRRGAGTQFETAKIVSKGEKLDLMDAEGWAPVIVGGTVLWISEKYVEKAGD